LRGPLHARKRGEKKKKHKESPSRSAEEEKKKRGPRKSLQKGGKRKKKRKEKLLAKRTAEGAIPKFPKKGGKSCEGHAPRNHIIAQKKKKHKKMLSSYER